VAAKALFGSCLYVVQDVLPRFGVEATLVDGRDLDAWRKAMRPNTRAVFFETPSNPCLELVDIAGVSRIAHEAGALVVVDNVFATPLHQRPLELGADVVVYSATKHIDGQGRVLGGLVLGSAKYISEQFHPYFKHTGSALSPFNAWVMLKSLETLPLRVRAQTETAARLADHMASATDRGLLRVIYPFRADHPQSELARRQMQAGSTLVSFEVAGGKAGAFRFLNALSIIRLSNNLGDAKSLITHPATTTHQRLKPELKAELGITDGLLRLSVGLEACDDLARDIDQALAALKL
jgi:O-succinylhomoserine sulfhydrylase